MVFIIAVSKFVLKKTFCEQFCYLFRIQNIIMCLDFLEVLKKQPDMLFLYFYNYIININFPN